MDLEEKGIKVAITGHGDQIGACLPMRATLGSKVFNVVSSEKSHLQYGESRSDQVGSLAK